MLWNIEFINPSKLQTQFSKSGLGILAGCIIFYHHYLLTREVFLCLLKEKQIIQIPRPQFCSLKSQVLVTGSRNKIEHCYSPQCPVSVRRVNVIVDPRLEIANFHWILSLCLARLMLFCKYREIQGWRKLCFTEKDSYYILINLGKRFIFSVQNCQVQISIATQAMTIERYIQTDSL